MADSHLCASCATSLPPGSLFCPRCGTKVAIDELLADTDPMMVPPTPVTRVASSPISDVPPSRPVLISAPVAQRSTAPASSLASPTLPGLPKPARPWWVFGVPIAVLACAAIVWAVLMGMPFSRDQNKLVRAAGPAGETVGESGGQTATVSRLGDPGGVQSTTPATATTLSSSTVDNTATTTLIIPTQLPPQAQPSVPMSPPIFVPQPAPQPPPGSMSSPGRTAPAPVERPVPRAPSPVAPSPVSQPSRASQISEEDAVSRLKSFVISNKSYDIPTDCLDVRSVGYKNVGYTLNVVDLCGPDPRSLGRWRVDAVTREVFRESGGRFVRP